jgi:hypothetical protein
LLRPLWGGGGGGAPPPRIRDYVPEKVLLTDTCDAVYDESSNLKGVSQEN